jgi:hypothetical protein
MTTTDLGITKSPQRHEDQWANLVTPACSRQNQCSIIFQSDCHIRKGFKVFQLIKNRGKLPALPKVTINADLQS